MKTNDWQMVHVRAALQAGKNLYGPICKQHPGLECECGGETWVPSLDVVDAVVREDILLHEEAISRMKLWIKEISAIYLREPS